MTGIISVFLSFTFNLRHFYCTADHSQLCKYSSAAKKLFNFKVELSIFQQKLHVHRILKNFEVNFK